MRLAPRSRANVPLARALALVASAAVLASLVGGGERTSKQDRLLFEISTGPASDESIPEPSSIMMIADSVLLGRAVPDSDSTSSERERPSEAIETDALPTAAPPMPVPVEPERRADDGPVARLCERLGLAAQSTEATELDRLLAEQMREARTLVEERAQGADPRRETYNAAVLVRLERLIGWYGRDGARLALEQAPFHFAEADGSLPRLSLVNGVAVPRSPDEEPASR